MYYYRLLIGFSLCEHALASLEEKKKAIKAEMKLADSEIKRARLGTELGKIKSEINHIKNPPVEKTYREMQNYVEQENYKYHLFKRIMEKCDYKKVVVLCKKLSKNCSFESKRDVGNLCALIYWLYILDKNELAKKCIELTRNIPFDQAYPLWSYLHSIRGLEIRMLFEEGKNEDAKKIIETLDRDLFEMPFYELDGTRSQLETPLEEKRHRVQERERRKSEDVNWVSHKDEINDALKDGDMKRANDCRFRALFELIGYTEAGFYPKLNTDKEEIEKIIKDYIKEILK
jgi:hypothetical protein